MGCGRTMAESDDGKEVFAVGCAADFVIMNAFLYTISKNIKCYLNASCDICVSCSIKRAVCGII